MQNSSKINYLCHCYPDLAELVEAVNTNTADIMKAVKSKCSLINFHYLEAIVDHFNLSEVKKHIETYNDIVDSFCTQIIPHHSYVKSFLIDHKSKLSTSMNIMLKLEWKPSEKTLDDIRGVFRKAFGSLFKHVHLVNVLEGCVAVICCAPRHLEYQLIKQARKNIKELNQIGLVQLKIANTDCINEEVSLFITMIKFKLLYICKCNNFCGNLFL